MKAPTLSLTGESRDIIIKKEQGVASIMNGQAEIQTEKYLSKVDKW